MNEKPSKTRLTGVYNHMSIDLELLAEKVYHLMQEELRLTRIRRGKTRIGR